MKITIEQAKNKIGYDRQLAMYGKQSADTVLQFYMLGWAEALESPSELSNQTDAVEFAEWLAKNYIYTNYCNHWREKLSSRLHSTTELYQEYKSLKQK